MSYLAAIVFIISAIAVKKSYTVAVKYMKRQIKYGKETSKDQKG